MKNPLKIRCKYCKGSGIIQKKNLEGNQVKCYLCMEKGWFWRPFIYELFPSLKPWKYTEEDEPFPVLLGYLVLDNYCVMEFSKGIYHIYDGDNIVLTVHYPDEFFEKKIKDYPEYTPTKEHIFKRDVFKQLLKELKNYKQKIKKGEIE